MSAEESRTSSGQGRGMGGAQPARPKRGGAPGSSGEMYGEGNWKADEEYRQGIKEFSQSHDSEKLARQAGEGMEDEKEGRAQPGHSSRRRSTRS